MSYTPGTWDTGEQIRNHKLATSIINRHGTEDCVFDQSELDMLKRFTHHLSVTTRDEILTEKGWVDEPQMRRGEKAANQGRSLSGLVIARYGTDDPALDDRDWELLADWFRKGMPTGEHVER